MCYFVSLHYILQQLEAGIKGIKAIVEKMLIGRKSRALGIMLCIIDGNVTQI